MYIYYGVDMGSGRGGGADQKKKKKKKKYVEYCKCVKCSFCHDAAQSNR